MENDQRRLRRLPGGEKRFTLVEAMIARIIHLRECEMSPAPSSGRFLARLQRRWLSIAVGFAFTVSLLPAVAPEPAAAALPVPQASEGTGPVERPRSGGSERVGPAAKDLLQAGRISLGKNPAAAGR
jgi:hypothetical protein